MEVFVIIVKIGRDTTVDTCVGVIHYSALRNYEYKIRRSIRYSIFCVQFVLENHTKDLTL